MNIKNLPISKKPTDASTLEVNVAQFSMYLWHAEQQAIHAHHAYRDDIWNYEEVNGPLKRRITIDDPEHADIRSFTADTYKTYLAAKRKVYTARSRLRKACSKLALI